MNQRRAGAMMSYAYSAAQIVVNLIYVPLLLGGIGQSEYGLFQMIGSIIAYLNVINSTLSAGATRYYCKYHALGDEDGMANTLGILRRVYRWAGLVVAGASVVMMGVVTVVYAGSFTAWEIRESCLMIAVLGVNLIVTMNNTISIAVINAHEEFVFLKATMLGTVVLQPVLVLLAIRFFPYALTVSLVQLLANTVCRGIQHGYARRRLGMDTRLRWLDRGLEHDLLTFSGGIVLAVVADQIFWKTDQLVLGYMYGTAAVAVYSVGSQIVNCYIPLGTAVASVFMPRVSELWHRGHNIKALSDLFLRVSRIALYPLLAVLLGFIVFGKDFVLLWAGEGYEDAYWVAVLELAPFTIDVSQNIGLTILQVMDRYGFRAKVYLVAAVLNIGLTVALSASYGVIGAAVASGIAMLISSGLILNWYYQTHIHLDMVAYWRSVMRQIVPLLALCVVSYVLWSSFHLSGGKGLLVGIAVFAVAFTMVSYTLSANGYERGLVRDVLGRLVHGGRA